MLNQREAPSEPPSFVVTAGSSRLTAECGEQIGYTRSFKFFGAVA